MKTQQINQGQFKSIHRGRRRRLPVSKLKLFPINANELSPSSGEQEKLNVFSYYSGQTINQESANRSLYIAAPFTLLGRTGTEITYLVTMPTMEAEQTACPTPTAHLNAHKMIAHLQTGGLKYPADDVYSDANGAIRLLWSFQGRNAELVFPSTETDYIYLYHSSPDKYGVETAPSPQLALDWINWAIGGSKPSSRVAA